MEIFAIVIALLANYLLEAMLGLILFSILIVLIWPKEGYDQTNDLAGRSSLLIMHAGVVIFKLAALFAFALFAMIVLLAGFMLTIGILNAIIA